MTELLEADIPAVPDNRSAFMHNKFFVFDTQCIWTGSFNISLNAAYKNNENAFYFCSSEAAKNYTTEFSEMFSGKFGRTSPRDIPYPTFTIGDTQNDENLLIVHDSRLAQDFEQQYQLMKILALVPSGDTCSK